MNNIFDFFNHISGFISVVALSISLYSIYYTRKENRIKIELTDCCWDEYDEENYPLIMFNLFNNSSKGVLINKIEFFNSQLEPLQVLLDYEVVPKDPENNYTGNYFTDIVNNSFSSLDDWVDPYYLSRNLKSPELIPANSDIDFTYYLKLQKIPKTICIQITSNEKLSWLSNKRIFYVQPTKAN